MWFGEGNECDVQGWGKMKARRTSKAEEDRHKNTPGVNGR